MTADKTSLSYECGFIVKGMALLLMVLGHCLSFPTWHVSTPAFFHSCKHIVLLYHITGICIPLFAFLTGWTYYQHKDKSLGYSFKKITKLLVDYWVVLIPISLFAFSCCSYTYSIEFIGDLFPVPALPHPLMVFAWYVWFYILMMVLFPLLGYAEAKARSVRTYGAVLILLIGIIYFSRLFYPWFIVIREIYPYALVGYFCAKFRILERCIEKIETNRIILSFICGILLIFFALLIHFIASYLTVKYIGDPIPTKMLKIFRPATVTSPLFVMGTILLHRHTRNNSIWVPFRYIGKHSMNIWFIHCIFFSNVTREVIQPIAFFWDNPIWIFCITILLSLLLSIIILPIQQQINRRILAPIFGKISSITDAISS